MPEIQFIRNKKYGTVGMGKNGWTKEVCNVSWNQKGPKLDLREWSPDYKKMSRGITLTKQEAKRLLSILATIDFEEFDATAAHPEAAMQVRPVYQSVQAQQPIKPTPTMPVQPTGGAVVILQEAPEDDTETGTTMDISDLEEDSAELLPTSI